MGAQFPTVLEGSREIAGYVAGLDDDADEELVLEMFRGCRATLQRVAIGSLEEGPRDAHVRNVAKERRYARKPLASMPPILVEDGVIQDGHHRFRVAKAQGAKEIMAYVVTEIAAKQHVGTGRQASGSDEETEAGITV